MSRRSPGEGTVARDGDGWVALIELPSGPTGKRRRRKRRARTKKEAIAALKELQAELADGLDPDGIRRTIADAVDAYLASRPRGQRSKKTVEMEEWRAGLIVAGLGRRRLGDLTVNDCDRFLADAGDGAFGSRAIGREALNRVRSLLVNVVKNEMRMGHINKNVADLSMLPVNDRPYDESDDDGDSSSSARGSLSYEEFAALWRMARMPLAVAVDLCGRNGLRPSEARGLRWECVDLDARTVTVNRQMSSSNKLTKPKTRRSLRTIPIDDLTVEALTTWRRRQDRSRKRAGDLWSDGPDLVISTKLGTGINKDNLRRMLTAACEDAGIDRFLPYELRYTAITFQLDSGAETWRVADWAGTSERMIEEIYRHRLTRVSDLGSIRIPLWTKT